MSPRSLVSHQWTPSSGYTDAISAGHVGVKPGWVRLNLNYFVPDEVADYLESYAREMALPVRTGTRIERFVIDDIDKSYRQSSEITQMWMDRWLLDEEG